jgi:endonuclease III
MNIQKNSNRNLIIEKLKGIGNDLLDKPYEFIHFTKNKEADNLLNDLKNYPHAFVLACILDRQIKAERAWLIPYLVYKELHSFKITDLLEKEKSYYLGLFKQNNYHRFNQTMAEYFYQGIQKIHDIYSDDASLIWSDYPMSATLIRRFLNFKGVGIKIATMAANILVREFKVKVKDYIYIDVSPDVHLWRVFKRIGLIEKDASPEELIYKARELNPDYPGIFDLSCWEIGRTWCKPTNPKCRDCLIEKHCEKNI